MQKIVVKGSWSDVFAEIERAMKESGKMTCPECGRVIDTRKCGFCNGGHK